MPGSIRGGQFSRKAYFGVFVNLSIDLRAPERLVMPSPIL